jgi:endonuclease/exonuclease/phosphatase (EEP) superfamily protein YafD
MRGSGVRFEAVHMCVVENVMECSIVAWCVVMEDLLLFFCLCLLLETLTFGGIMNGTLAL